MTRSTPFDFSDAALERMLAERAGPGAPATLVMSIVGAIEGVPQRRRFLLPPLGWGRGSQTRTLVAAAALLLATVLAGVALVGAIRDSQTVPPDLLSSPTPSPAASIPGSAQPTGPVNGERMIVLGLGTGSRVEIHTLDPFTNERVDIGVLQPQAPMGQTIHWASDRGHAISFSSSDSVQAFVDVLRGRIDPLPLPPTGSRDAVSPDGNLVARLEDAELVVLDLDGNEVARTQLPDGIQPLINLAWAPDASQVVVSTCRPCVNEGSDPQHLLLVTPVADGIRDLSVGSGDYVGYATWSPDKATIVAADPGGILAVDVGDGTVTRLTDQPDAFPEWSPNSTRIAYTRTGPAGGLYVMAADGSNPTLLVASPGDFSIFDPRWSPDGQWLAYHRDRTDSSLGDLWIVPSAGGEPRLIVSNAVADW